MNLTQNSADMRQISQNDKKTNHNVG